MDNTLLTVDEVAKILRVDPTTTRRWIKQGTLEAIRLPHRGTRESYRIKKETLDKLLNGTTPQPQSEPDHRDGNQAPRQAARR